MGRFSLSLGDYVKEDYVPLILRCLLDRIPVIVYGSEAESADNLASLMIRFLPNRLERVFLIDFATLREYNYITELEKQDLECPRSVFRAPCNSANHILEGYTDFRGWVVSIVDGEKNIQECIQRIEEHSQLTLTVKIFKNSHSISELTPSKYQNTLDTSFERDLINKIESESASSIERVKRVLKSKICGSTVSPIFSSTLLNFEAEEEGLKESLFNSQIFLFVNACKRALYLLTRLDLINEFNIEGVVSEKTLLDSIKYNCASASRILDFIYAEWGLSFHKYVKSGKLSVLGDIIEGLWG